MLTEEPAVQLLPGVTARQLGPKDTIPVEANLQGAACSRLVVLFADISGSTRLYETLGDQAARKTIAGCLSILTEIVHRQGGTLIKTIGDEVMSTFSCVDDAAAAACEMQEAMAGAAAKGALPSIRVGLHYGRALVEENDVFGDAVNLAARVVTLAKADQILTTGQLVKSLSPELRVFTRLIDRTTLKGKREVVDIYEVVWQGENITHIASGRFLARESSARLRLHMQGNEVELDQQNPDASIGRSKENDIMLGSDRASRRHARIECRRGKFFLRDLSINGTFVHTREGKTLFIHREEVLLLGSGVISLVEDLDHEIPDLIRFSCES